MHTCCSICPLCLSVCTCWSIYPTLSQSAYLLVHLFHLLVHLSHFASECIPVGPSISHCLRMHTCWSIYPTLTVSECIPVVPSVPLYLSVYTCCSVCPVCLSVCTCCFICPIVSVCVPVVPSVPLSLSISVCTHTCFSFWQSEEAAVNLFFHLTHSPASSAVFLCAALTSEKQTVQMLPTDRDPTCL